MPEPPPSRRQFLGGTGAALVAGALPTACVSTGTGSGAGEPAAAPGVASGSERVRSRVIASTWKFGREANAVAWARLLEGVSHPIDACEAGMHVTEADPDISSVGYGGRPNADGEVELDSCIMRGDTLACGGVAGLKNILHPVSVARAVMEHTPHVLLVGEGALAFARSRGFPEQDMLSPGAREAWERWRVRKQQPQPEDDHDTIGMIVLDGGRLGMGVTTSGIAYKLPGRVGDSPIVGAGGYCDDEVGACVATGDGEEMIRTCASFAVVDAMRHGASVDEACAEVLGRIRRRAAGKPSVSLVAVDRAGRAVGHSLRGGFEFAVTDDEGTQVLDGAVVP